MKIIVDAFGGDNAPKEIVKGCFEAVIEKNGFEITLTGKEEEIRRELSELGYNGDRISIVNCTEVITNDDVPTTAIRHKTDSSVVVGLKLLKEDKDAKVFLSAGSTGAVLAGGLLRVGRIKGVSRPGLAPILPTAKNGTVLLIDCGANVDCKPINLLHFAIMGSCFMKSRGIENPRVALLSNGTEDKKGNELNHEAFALIKQSNAVNFVGNMEARELLSGDYDVVVSDGFNGNIALKSCEGTVLTLFDKLKEIFTKNFFTKLSYMFLKKHLKKLKLTMDYNDNGGAVFLGIEKPIIKMHGASKAKAVKNAVFQALSIAESKLSEDILEKITALTPVETATEEVRNA